MKKHRVSLIFGICAILMSFAEAKATDITLTWTAPTGNTDGTTPAKFEGFNVYRSTALPVVVGGIPLAGKSPNGIAAATLTYTDKAVPPGTYYYAVTAWHCEAAGCTESGPATSVAVVVAVVVPKCNPPGVPVATQK